MSQKAKDVWLFVIWLVVFAFLAGLLVLINPKGSSAPAPIGKTPTRSDGRPILQGRYAYRLGYTNAECVVSQLGAWRTDWCGSKWKGFWEVKGNRLTIHEVPERVFTADENPQYSSYSVTLEPKTWRGRTDAGASFEILLPKLSEK